MSVYTKLMAARMKLHGQAIKKSGRNTFANYNYMELADFLIPTQTIFAEMGLCGIVSFTAETASLTIIDTEDGSQHVITSPMGSAALKGCHEVQNIGAVETYQRRYLWVTAMEIVEHDALDSSPPADSLVPVLEASITREKTKKAEAQRTTIMKVRNKIQEHVVNDRPLGVTEEWDYARSMGEEFQSGVWAGLTTPEREYVRLTSQNKTS